MAARFLQLGVVVEAGVVYAGTLGIRGRPLGPLAGSHAELGDPTRHRRAGAAVMATATGLGVLGLAPLLSKRSKVIAFVVLANGNVHQRTLDGNLAIRQGQSDVVKFNALAAATANSLGGAAVSRDESTVKPSRDLGHLGLGEFPAYDQYLIWRATEAFPAHETLVDVSSGLLSGHSGSEELAECQAVVVVGDTRIVIFCDPTAGDRLYEYQYSDLTAAQSLGRAEMALVSGDDSLTLSRLHADSAERLTSKMQAMMTAASERADHLPALKADQSTGQGDMSVADEIRKFADLHAEGILTDEEFAAKKKQLLDLPSESDSAN